MYEANTAKISNFWILTKISRSCSFLSPPVQVARWAHMHRFLSVRLSVCVSVCRRMGRGIELMLLQSVLMPTSSCIFTVFASYIDMLHEYRKIVMASHK